MELSPDYQFDMGDKVVARSGHYAGQVGTVLSRRRGFGAPAYTVDFGQGSCLVMKQDELSAAANRSGDGRTRQ
jgi:hypothetical protein